MFELFGFVSLQKGILSFEGAHNVVVAEKHFGFGGEGVFEGLVEFKLPLNNDCFGGMAAHLLDKETRHLCELRRFFLFNHGKRN